MLMAYGYGDGGGGPTREMIENSRVLKQMPATPRPARAAFASSSERWRGAGAACPHGTASCISSCTAAPTRRQARNKRANRKSEFLLHDAEFLAAWLPASTRLCVSGRGAAGRPGSWSASTSSTISSRAAASARSTSSRGSSTPRWRAAAKQSRQERWRPRRAIRARGYCSSTPPASSAATWPAGRHMRPASGWCGATVQRWLRSRLGGGTWLAAGALPALQRHRAATSAGDGRRPPEGGWVIAEPGLLENERLRVELDAAGDITRIFDKDARRRCCRRAPSGTNGRHSRTGRWIGTPGTSTSSTKTSSGWPSRPARCAWSSGPAARDARDPPAHPEQQLRAAHLARRGSPRIDFDTEIDWRERHTLLKVAFPVEVRAPRRRTKSSSATFSGRRTGTRAGTGRASRPARRSGWT